MNMKFTCPRLAALAATATLAACGGSSDNTQQQPPAGRRIREGEQIELVASSR